MATHTYRLSTKCVASLDGIADYLIERNESAARRVVAALRDAFAALARNPGLGQTRDDVIAGLRVFSPPRPAHNYVICYYGTPNGVESQMSSMPPATRPA